MKNAPAKILTFLFGLTAAVLLVFLFRTLSPASAQEAKTVSSGKEVYTKKCASCHGKGGEGVASVAKMLKAPISDLRGRPVNADTLAAWKKIIVDGKGKMPGKAKSKLTDAEIDSALAYTALLAKATSAKPAKADSAKAGASEKK
jgi:mono/diheme cytochrome c family protein